MPFFPIPIGRRPFPFSTRNPASLQAKPVDLSPSLPPSPPASCAASLKTKAPAALFLKRRCHPPFLYVPEPDQAKAAAEPRSHSSLQHSTSVFLQIICSHRLACRPPSPQSAEPQPSPPLPSPANHRRPPPSASGELSAATHHFHSHQDPFPAALPSPIQSVGLQSAELI